MIQDFKSHAEAHVDGVLEQMNGREDALQTRITQNECDLSALTELSSRAAEVRLPIRLPTSQLASE